MTPSAGPADLLLDALAAYGLAAYGLAERHPATPVAPLDSRAWTELLSGARAERLDPVLAWAIALGDFPATVEQREQAYERHRSSMASALALERLLLELHAVFTCEGIEHRVLKGPALAHLDGPDPSWRAFGDLDLLVPPTQLALAGRVLADRGGRRRYPEPRPGFDRRFSKGMAFVLPDGHEIDLHRTLCQGPFGLTIDPDELLDGTETFTVAGVALPALDRPRRFLHACIHAVLGQPSPRRNQLRDVALTCPRSAGRLLDALALAERWQVGTVVAAAVDETSARLGWMPPAALRAWRAAAHPSRQDRWRLEGYRDTPRAPVLRALTSMAALPGVRDKLAYGLAVAAPHDARGTNVQDRARRALRALTGHPRS
ncbi:nucleotidyltransferase family protein [Rhabdothermincola sediminis]|uniref:nucleotidyltransferase family protein n=1 Tax=Rhabdothermincola sediminis TaxID=2751370 RepID=UPI001AA07D5A|nr:nucleotidyltransferase family protein [Rhabdothermincola sediminis]